MDRNSYGSSEEISCSSSHNGGKYHKDVPLETFGGARDVENNFLDSDASSAPPDAQAGVKNIEAVSLTWTKWGLIAAYLRYVELHTVTDEYD